MNLDVPDLHIAFFALKKFSKKPQNLNVLKIHPKILQNPTQKPTPTYSNSQTNFFNEKNLFFIKRRKFNFFPFLISGFQFILFFCKQNEFKFYIKKIFFEAETEFFNYFLNSSALKLSEKIKEKKIIFLWWELPFFEFLVITHFKFFDFEKLTGPSS